MKKALLFLFFLPLYLFSQDIEVSNVLIVGGEPLCPDDSVSFDITFTNKTAAPEVIDNRLINVFVNGPNPTPLFSPQIDPAVAAVPGSGALTIRYPDDFVGAPAAIDFSVPGIYSLTVSLTVPGDTDPSNDVFNLLDIDVYTPAIPSLESYVSGIATSTLCQGESIAFEISPNSATATYTFLVNGDVKQTAYGNNTFTSSTIGANAIADGDVITIQMIDSNGCITDASSESITVSVNNPPITTMTSTAPEGYFCDGELITFTATGGPSYQWLINGTPQSGATLSSFTTALNDGDTVKIIVTNASGCSDEQEITFQKLEVTDDGTIALNDPLDSDICDGEDPGLIGGDGIIAGTATATVSDGSPEYQWQNSPDGTTWSDIDGAVNENYDPPALSATTYYRRNVLVSPGTKECEVDGTDVVCNKCETRIYNRINNNRPIKYILPRGNNYCFGKYRSSYIHIFCERGVPTK